MSHNSFIREVFRFCSRVEEEDSKVTSTPGVPPVDSTVSPSRTFPFNSR